MLRQRFKPAEDLLGRRSNPGAILELDQRSQSLPQPTFSTMRRKST
jgi:hypothetical protein